MKKMYIILFLFLCMVSCCKKGREKKSIFNTIDYSYSSDNVCNSIKINNDGKVFVLDERQRIDLSDEKSTKEEVFIQTILSSMDIDSLSTLVMRINYVDLDTLYETNCVDCEIQNLVIYKQSEFIKLFMEGTPNEDKRLIDINNLTNYLKSLKQQVIMESGLVKFESKTSDFNSVPPPPKLIKMEVK